MAILIPASFPTELASSISRAFKKLLSEKHLYQSVEVDDAFISSIAKQRVENYTDNIFAKAKVTAYIDEGRRTLGLSWIPVLDTAGLKIGEVHSALQGVGFEYPTIHTFCHNCKQQWPFNPVGRYGVHESGKFSRTEQWFFVSYECQSCKMDAVRFLVRRSGKKLTLSGRDPMESVPVHKDIPKHVAQFFSSAVIAHHAGQTLAGIFFLRVFIEQHWNSIPDVAGAIKQNARLSGEDRGNLYKATLPEDFKSRFPSLRETYSTLSASIHEAKADAVVFDQACADIISHFEARRLFKLVIPAS